MTLRLAAVDLGASSGRVMVGDIGEGTLQLTEVHRFWNGPVDIQGTLHWDILHLYRETLVGLTKAAAGGPIDGIGIDSWAVDYGLLDESGRLLSNPIHYRDSRTDGVMDEVLRTVPAEDLYAITASSNSPSTPSTSWSPNSPSTKPTNSSSSPTSSPTGSPASPAPRRPTPPPPSCTTSAPAPGARTWLTESASPQPSSPPSENPATSSAHSSPS